MMVKTIAHSVSPQGIEIYTAHARYWRAIHSEMMTHRDFGRNARSSRAVPSMTLLSEPIFIPQFGLNQPGMQAKNEELFPGLQDRWAREWQELAEICREQVKRWQAEGMHKQWANRPLEWFGWIDVLITATKWENFFALRISEYAQPEFDELARAIRDEMDSSVPVLRHPGDWHLPYVTDSERLTYSLDDQQRLSVARCARLSYRPFDGNADYEAEMTRYKKLMGASPVHASPAEHQATPDTYDRLEWGNPELHGNLHGWVQYRKTVPGEVIRLPVELK
jgi:hypothetical protein